MRTNIADVGVAISHRCGYILSMARLKAPQRREQLISVATRQFAKFGYDATTTDAIAKAAGVTEPILYRHFGSKQELFIAISAR